MAPPSEEPAELWLLLLQTVPLVVRRSFPVPVLVVTASAATVQMLIGMPQTNAVLGEAVAVSTVVSRTAWPRSVGPPLILLAVGVIASAAGGHPLWPRSVLILAIVLLLAWAFGDAVGRRRAVSADVERDLAARREANLLRTRVAAAGERLRIERGLHELVGAGLDAVLAQAGAARLRRGHAAVAQLTAIETVGREVLAELDRVMDLLRCRSPVRPIDGTERPHRPVAGWDRRSRWSTGRVPVLVDVAVAGGLAALATSSALSVPPAERPASVWVVALVAAATLPLVLRRRMPEAVAFAVTAALSVQLVVGMPANDGLLAVAVAVHAVAAHRTPRRAVLLAVLSVGVLVAVALASDPVVALPLGLGLGLFVVGALYIGGTDRLAAIHDASWEERLATAEEEGRLPETNAFSFRLSVVRPAAARVPPRGDSLLIGKPANSSTPSWPGSAPATIATSTPPARRRGRTAPPAESNAQHRGRGTVAEVCPPRGGRHAPAARQCDGRLRVS